MAKRNCWLRLRRHTYYWTGNGYQSFWGGWRNEKRCQECGLTLYVPGVRGMRVEPMPPPGVDPLDHVGGAPPTMPSAQLEEMKCPFCPWTAMVDPTLVAQTEVEHMTYCHPDIVLERQNRSPDFGPGERGIG